MRAGERLPCCPVTGLVTGTTEHTVPTMPSASPCAPGQPPCCTRNVYSHSLPSRVKYCTRNAVLSRAQGKMHHWLARKGTPHWRGCLSVASIWPQHNHEHTGGRRPWARPGTPGGVQKRYRTVCCTKTRDACVPQMDTRHATRVHLLPIIDQPFVHVPLDTDRSSGSPSCFHPSSVMHKTGRCPTI